MTAAVRTTSGQHDASATTARAGGVAAIVAGFGAIAVAGLEARRTSLGFDDADDPRVMLAFFREHADLYTTSGIVLVLVAVALAVAVLALWRVTASENPGLLIRIGTVFGVFSSAFLFAQGALRIQSPATILHIASVDEQSGRAAYAAVQMAGTQGLGSAGGFALAVWAIAMAMGTWRARSLPRLVAVLAVLPAAYLLIALFGPLIAALGGLYPLYVVSVVVGVPAWCMAVGVALLRIRPSTVSRQAPGQREDPSGD
jgi:hypothetical protein